MPEDNFGAKYTYKNSGTNSQGNHYCTRDFGPDVANTNSYHYSNQNGSYYYSNPNGSTYYNNGKGDGWHTPPASSSSSFVQPEVNLGQLRLQSAAFAALHLGERDSDMVL